MRPRDFLLVVTAAALWGGGGVVGTLLGDRTGMHSLSIAMWRMLVAGFAILVALAAARRLRLRSLTPAMWRLSLVTGALTAVFESLYFLGISLSSVGLSTLIGIGSAPVFVAIWDWLSSRRTPQRLTLIALALALGGLSVLLSGSLEAGENGLAGALVALGAGATFAAVTVVNRRHLPGHDAITHTGVAFAAGGLMLIPAAATMGLGWATDAAGWGLTLVLGIVVTALAYAAYFSGLRTVPAFVATIVALLEPLVAALLAALVFAERLGWTGLVGGAVLGAAVVLLRPQRDEPESLH